MSPINFIIHDFVFVFQSTEPVREPVVKLITAEYNYIHSSPKFLVMLSSLTLGYIKLRRKKNGIHLSLIKL